MVGDHALDRGWYSFGFWLTMFEKVGDHILYDWWPPWYDRWGSKWRFVTILGNGGWTSWWLNIYGSYHLVIILWLRSRWLRSIFNYFSVEVLIANYLYCVLNLFTHCGISIILLQVLWTTLTHSFCIVERLHSNFHNVES